MTVPDPPLIFISHYNQEKEVAIQLQKVLEDIFLSCEVFVSSDQESIPLGRVFDEVILGALKRADIALYLLSPASVTRPWIHFEIGAIWMAGKSMVPICFGGLLFDQLPGPIFGRNGINANDPEGLKKLVKTIASALGTQRVPSSANWSGFLEAVRACEEITLQAQVSEVVSDIAQLCRLRPDFHDVIRPQAQEGYGADLPLASLQPDGQEALNRLRKLGYITMCPRGRPGETTSYSIFGTQQYSELYVTSTFAALLQAALEP